MTCLYNLCKVTYAKTYINRKQDEEKIKSFMFETPILEKVLTLLKTVGMLRIRQILGKLTKFHEIWMSY